MTKHQDQSQIKWVADFIWNIADDRLRDVYVRGKYRDVILPFTVLRRLDAVLESTKQAVLERKKFLDTHKVAEQDGALRMAAGQAFYNTSDFTLEKLKASSAGQRLRDDFIDYLDGFSPNVQEILTKFKFRDQIQTLVDAHVLGLKHLQAGKVGAGIEVFGLGTGNGFSVREVIDQSHHVTNRPVPIVEGPRRAGDAVKLVSGSEKAITLLGWDPKRSTMAQMVTDAWRWHQNGGYER